MPAKHLAYDNNLVQLNYLSVLSMCYNFFFFLEKQFEGNLIIFTIIITNKRNGRCRYDK